MKNKKALAILILVIFISFIFYELNVKTPSLRHLRVARPDCSGMEAKTPSPSRCSDAWANAGITIYGLEKDGET